MSPRISITLLLSAALLDGCQSNFPTVKTIPNFATVDSHRKIYRGGEPLTKDGWDYLKRLGVHTVVKLNTDRESLDEGAKRLHFKVVSLPIDQKAQTHGPIDPSTIRAAVSKMAHGAVFVHCGSDVRSRPNSLYALFDLQGGQDRTSLVVGSYRVGVDHWKKEAARAEMKLFHFHALLLPGLAHYWRDEVE
ncbi:MAG: hypothetical protein H0X40_06595 [Chthoniobacterales bacterium]|nr:hypothetical protein [Chthoniobacterales bacterium]